MAIGSFRGQLEGAISKRLTADPYAKRQEAAQADYQAQAEKSRQDLSERLNRLGVLRGSGKTASQFGEFEAGVLRGQQAIGAQFEAQRDAGVSQAIQQGIGMYGTTSQAGIAGRQQSEAERMGRFSRDLSTRQYLSQEALNRDRQREAERAALVQEGFQRAGIVGQYDGQRTVDQQRQDLSYRLGLAQAFGTDLGGDDVTRQTEARKAREQQEAFQRAGIMGEFDGDRTLAAQQLYGTRSAEEGAAQTMQQRELELRRGELLGEIGTERTLAAQQALGTIDGADTLARDALQQEARQAGLSRDLAREELYGRTTTGYERAMGGAQTLAAQEATRERTSREDQARLDRELAREELMGFREIDGRREQTLAAREAGAQRRLTEAEGRREREARATEAGLSRDLAREELYGGYTTQYDREMGRVGTLAKTEGAAERRSREAMQQAQFDQETTQADLARTLAREELYGSANPMEWDRTLASTGQRAQIAAERRRLDEMEAAGLSQREIALRQQDEMERSALIREGFEGRRLDEVERAALVQEGFEGRRVGVAEAARRDQVAQERRRMALAEQEMYGGAEEISLDTLNIDPGLEMAVGRDTAIRQALQQQLGREPSQDELAAVTGGRSIRGRETLAARESRVGRDFTGEQAELDRELTRGEAALDRGLTTDQARLQRGLAREEMYGTADPRLQTGDTLAARESREARNLARSEAALDRALTREGTTEQSRLQEINLYGRELSEAERSMIASGRGGPSTVAARDLTQQGEQFDRELTDRREQADLQRILMREEMYGTADPMGQTGETLAAREGREARRLGRDEIASREGLAARDITSREEQNRLQRTLAREELYGGPEGMVDYRAGTLASREADRDYRLRAELGRGGLEVDRDRVSLAEEELYGGVGRRGLAGSTLASREADRAAGFERERLDFEGERVGLAREAGQREAFRNQLAEEELYGGANRRGSGVGTFAAQEAGRSRTERQERYALEDQRYDAATILEAERYETSRQDYEADRRARDEDREWQRQMDVFGARRAAEAVDGAFRPEEEDALRAQLDPSYTPPRTMEEWDLENPAPTQKDFLAGTDQRVMTDAQMEDFNLQLQQYQRARRQRQNMIDRTNRRAASGMMG